MRAITSDFIAPATSASAESVIRWCSTGSTIRTTEMTKYEGKEYPKFVVEISSKSHPFYTGEDRMLDKTGRVERFKQRASKKKS